ncbi:MAG TPA: hypothetical protein PLA46_02885 [Phycicoccus sp.]|jgi:hypothetical protein|nr:hypothetical protein [Phycicoccus sp.]HQK32981.1 hypothetical protein [Phycicoccus sp.]HQV90499.1 hypothetical protein [Phycicoccus sp.]HQY95488.1 hypothetical protein [Phycicoccus sp.]HRA44145.1 hypothetical protein [Phycicoccus sp.]
MADRSGSAEAVVRDPRVELAAMIEQEVSRLESRRHELARARELMSSLQGVTADTPGVMEHLPFEIAAATVSQLLRDTVGEMRNLVLVLDEGPALDAEAARQAQDRILAGAVHRTLYPAHALNSAHTLKWVRSWGAVGEVQRITQTVPTEFVVFGTDAVIALAKWGDLNSGYAISRHPLVIQLHIAYFEELWSHAQPVAHPDVDARDDDQLLQYLGLGLKDEAIARVLGLGLRTVRRRVAELMAAHGVETRYQLGVAIGARRAAQATKGAHQGLRPR